MNTALLRRAIQIFEEAVDLPGTRCARCLEERCGSDPALRSLVEEMLECDRLNTGAALEPPLGAAHATLPTPMRIGHYEIVRLIAEGGMGSVYEARQDSPRRGVALKVMRTSLPTHELAARFRREAELLGALHHPGIAAVYEAGEARPVTPDGPGSPQAFLAMELVHGPTITEWCARADVGHRDRLELLARVCDAVEHAHQQGIVHRDLKPSNILVDVAAPLPQPKVLDFGVARVLTADGGVQTLQTEAGRVLGTLPYMSPEQVAGESAAVDHRTDIYALGVILYEVLAGRQPLEVRDRSFADAARIIREEEPSRLATVNTLCRGDLDTIVAKAMAKDPSRRYATAAELAADLRRHLRDEPIVARPTSAMYQLRKFAKRNKPLVAGVAAVFVALVLGIIGTTTFALRAQRRADETRLVAEFQAEMLEQIDAWRMGEGLRADIIDQAAENWRLGDEAQISERRARLQKDLEGVSVTTLALRSLEKNLFEGTLAAIEKQFRDRPLLKASMLQNTGVTMLSLGLRDPARAPLQEALDIRRSILGDTHIDTLDSLLAMGRLNSRIRPAEAETMLRTVLKGQLRTLSPKDPKVLTSKFRLGSVMAIQNRYAEAEPYLMEALIGRRAVLGENDQDTIDAMIRIGQLYVWWGKLDKAEGYIQEADERARRVLPSDNWFTYGALSPLANLRLRQGRLEDAVIRWRESADAFRRISGEDDGSTLFSEELLGWTLLLQRDLAGADAQLQHVLQGRQRNRSDNAWDALDALSVVWEFGVLRQMQNKAAEAEAHFELALKGYREVLGPHPDATMLHVVERLSDVMDQTDRSSEADELRNRHVRECLDDFRGPSRAMNSLHLVQALQFRECLSYPLAAPSKLVQIGANGEFVGEVTPISSRFYVLLSKIHDGGKLRDEFLDACRANYGPDDERTLSAISTLAWHLAQERRLDDARPLAWVAVEGFRRTMKTPNRAMLDAMDTLATIVHAMEGPEHALPLFDQIHKEYLDHAQSLGLPDTGTCIRRAQCLAALNRLQDAELALLECHDALPEPRTRDLRVFGPLATALIDVYDAWHAADPASGHDADAAAWRDRLTAAEGPQAPMSRGSPTNN